MFGEVQGLAACESLPSLGVLAKATFCDGRLPPCALLGVVLGKLDPCGRDARKRKLCTRTGGAL